MEGDYISLSQYFYFKTLIHQKIVFEINKRSNNECFIEFVSPLNPSFLLIKEQNKKTV